MRVKRAGRGGEGGRGWRTRVRSAGESEAKVVESERQHSGRVKGG